MKRVLPYFTSSATVRYGVKPWRTPPHEYLANMKLSSDAVAAFVAIYGSPFEDFYLPAHVPATVAEGKELALRGKPPLSLDLFRITQDAIRETWKHGPSGKTYAMANEQREGAPPTVSGNLAITADGIEIVAADVWSYIKLAVAHDSAMGKLHICKNPECTSPYFKEQRAGQTFCSHACAVRVSYRRFRAKTKAAKKQTKRGK